MTSHKSWRGCGAALGALSTAVLSISVAQAAPPPSTGGGTIYYDRSGVVWMMNSDGIGKTALPSGVTGVPSRSMHGSARWFLQSREIPGEFYPGSATAQARTELFAVRDDGNTTVTKQLTMDANLQNSNQATGWMPGDAQVYFVARRWAGAQVVQGGVYVADILFDSNGDVVGLAAQPAAPAIPMSLVTWPANYPYSGDPGPDVLTLDWAPSGLQIVYRPVTIEQLRIADLGGTTRLLFGGGRASTPVWSPDGTLIAFSGGVSLTPPTISTIRPDGTGVRIVVSGTLASISVGAPRWSPTGSHLAYVRWNRVGWPIERDIYRAKADGTQQTNLTGDFTGTPYINSWR